MMRRRLERLVRMDHAEVAWRGRTAARTVVQRARASVRTPQWDRDGLQRVWSTTAAPAVTAALAARRWTDAHRALTDYFSTRPPLFVVAPAHRADVAQRIRAAFPDAARHAAARADRVLDDRYDLLGYEALHFNGDWHFDPVHRQRAPRLFWSSVPYLDRRCGDHKIIWELNRHQSWLALGRAYWLTRQPAYRARFITELASWLDANPPLTGINWASMLELAFRSISWLWALHLFVDPRPDDRDPWTVDLLLALDRQLTHIEQNLSYYFSPNTHLLGEALALYAAGRALPELAASDRRAALGRRILVAEISRQIAADGGYCERSTHYHRYTLDFYLLALAVARITRDPIAAVFEDAARRMAGAARQLADDNGRLVRFGDDDGGLLLPIAGRAPDDLRDTFAIAAALTRSPDLAIGAAPEEAHWMLSHPALSASLERAPRAPAAPASAALPDTGYYVSRSSSGEHLVIDGGPHGYQNCGHAHADALSVTLSIRSVPLLIDPGTGCYTADADVRNRFRSTALHNTVVVDDRWQSVPTGPFHWATKADGYVHRWRTSEAFDYFDGSHRGYAPTEHRRRVFVLHADLLVVVDVILGGGRHSAAAHWQIGSDWHVEARSASATFTAAHARVGLVVPSGTLTAYTGDEQRGLGWQSPVYGRVEAATTVRIAADGEGPLWMGAVFDLNPVDPVQSVEWVPVWTEAGVMAHGAALRILREGHTDYLLTAEPLDDHTAPTWRVAELETDARMLFCRVAASGEIARVALVDGSRVRGAGRRALGLSLGRPTPSLYVDETAIRTYTPCVVSPGS